MEKVFTRQQYINGECTHSEYYSQFVYEHTLKTVERYITLKRICNSTDEHFNDIDLRHWDFVANIIGKSNPISDGVCIAKEAARIIKVNHQ